MQNDGRRNETSQVWSAMEYDSLTFTPTNQSNLEKLMKRKLALTTLALAMTVPGIALADDGISPGLFTANNVWMMLAAGLVFIMHLGFAMLETGLTRAKNSVNILFKNTFIICSGILTYYLCGFNLMYPGFAEGSAGILGFAGFGLSAGFDAGANTPALSLIHISEPTRPY